MIEKAKPGDITPTGELGLPVKIEKITERYVTLLASSHVGEKKIPFSRELVLVTPEMAKTWLEEKNKHNYRKLNADHVHKWFKKMQDGAFIEAFHEGIAFDWWDDLGNGQHRLSALVLYGKPLKMWVSRGVNPAEFLEVDRPLVRRSKDDLVVLGLREGLDPGRTISIVNRLVNGLKPGKSPDNAIELAIDLQDRIAPVYAIVKELKRWKTEIAAAFVKATFDFEEARVLAAAARYVTAANTVNFGTDEDDPLKRLYLKIEEDKDARHRRPQNATYALAVSAIRAELEGRKLSKLPEALTDFTAPWEEGYKKPEMREKARRAHQTTIENIRSGDRDELALNALIDARERGAQVGIFFDGETGKNAIQFKFPPKFPPLLTMKIKELQPEITEIVLAEHAATLAAVPVVPVNGNGHGNGK